MRSRAALVILTWVVVELVVLGWSISVVGLGLILAALSLKAFAGLLLVRRGARGLLRQALHQRAMPDRAMLAAAGLLLVIPGFLSGVVGALLLVPPVRAVVRSMISTRIAQFVPSHPRDVVDVDVVNEDITKLDQRLGGASELR